MTAKQFYDWQTGGGAADAHGILLRVACLEDTLLEKIEAFRAPDRRRSKTLKYLSDIARLVESHPHLERLLSDDVREKLRAAH